jgi:hypothetical protein
MLACFMQDEISYLIQKVEMATYYFSSIEHLVNRTSAWLWMIMRAFKAMPHAPLCLNPEQIMRGGSEYATAHTEGLSRSWLRQTTTDPSGYCENHKGEGWKPTSQVNHGSSVDMEQVGSHTGADT